MIAFVVLVVLLVAVGAVWLWQRAQGRERFASDKELTDALKKLKAQGKGAVRVCWNKDKENGK